MKFNKLLSRAISLSVPGWSAQWIEYKSLKKLLSAAVGGSETPAVVPSELAGEALAARLAADPREVDFFRKLQVLPLSFFQRNSTGDLLSRGLADANQLQNTLTTVANELVKSPASLIGSICYIAWVAYHEQGVALVLVTLAVVPLTVLPIRYIGKKLIKRAGQIQAELGSVTDIFSLRGNYHPSRPWFISGRLAAKRVSELLLGSVNSSYAAGLVGARITYDVTNKWSVGAITTMLVGQGGALQYAYGVEVGYTLADNLLGTLGYNWRGFSDTQLADGNYTNRGWVLGVRYKFDESLLGANDPAVNKTLSPTVAPAKP